MSNKISRLEGYRMGRRINVVAEYDYYTLDQAREIIQAEERQKKQELIEDYLSVVAILVIPVLFVVHWIIFGY